MSHSRMIYDHFKARSAKTFMVIYGSLMDIYDQEKTVIHDKNNFVSFKNDLWPFPARSAKIFMGIYGSLMDIYDQKNREAQKTFQGHFLSH